MMEVPMAAAANQAQDVDFQDIRGDLILAERVDILRT
jgi:hypothetical protein